MFHFFLTHTSTILIVLKASHLLVDAKMPRVYNSSEDKLPCHCHKTLYDGINKPIVQLYFVRCQVCTRNYNLHERCHPLLPGCGKIVLMESSELLTSFICNGCKLEKCSCGKKHHETKPKVFIAKCNVGTEMVHWFYTLDKCNDRIEAKKKVGCAEPAF